VYFCSIKTYKMKKNIFPFLLLLLSYPLLSQANRHDLESLELKGKVKNITTYKLKIVVLDSLTMFEMKFEYDKKNFLKKVLFNEQGEGFKEIGICKDAGGSHRNVKHYLFDEKGRVTSKKAFSCGKKEPWSDVSYKYGRDTIFYYKFDEIQMGFILDSLGRKIKEINLSDKETTVLGKTGKLNYYTIFGYFGEKQEKKIIEKAGMFYTETISYDPVGNFIKEKIVYADGRVEERTEQRRGTKIVKIQEGNTRFRYTRVALGEMKLQNKFIDQYDEIGNIIRTFSVKKDGSIIVLFEYKITYF